MVLDKALYKPGETVQIRALSLGTDLLPLAGAQARHPPCFTPLGPYAQRCAALRRALRDTGAALHVGGACALASGPARAASGAEPPRSALRPPHRLSGSHLASRR